LFLEQEFHFFDAFESDSKAAKLSNFFLRLLIVVMASQTHLCALLKTKKERKRSFYKIN